MKERGGHLHDTKRETRESAVILHGLMHRSLHHTVQSFRKCVVEPLERLGRVHVFFHSWEVTALNNPRAGEAGEALDSAEVARCLPEARGLFESQEAFDASVDWERLLRNNPMRHCCGNEDEARVTLMNLRRALESQERAWRFFEETKTKRYDLVVATRADLRFLEELAVPEVLVGARCGRMAERGKSMERSIGFDAHGPPLQASQSLVGDGPPLQAMLWLPKFHSWGGVNDRFAVGNEEGIRVWSNRVAFAEEWLERAKDESAEWLLMKWLEKRRVRVGFLDFTFQRVRAHGEVAERDRELAACGKKDRMRASSRLTERFLILAREAGSQAEGLRRVLEPLGRVEVVVDRECGSGGDVGTGCPDDGLGQVVPATVWIPDEEAEGFGGLMGRTGDFPRITAWSRAMAHLAATLRDDEAVWFVEDDVAGDSESFARLVGLTRAGNPDLAALDIRSREADRHWHFWHRAEGWFEQPARAFQPLCRLSGRLIREALRFREERGGFTFHEVLFASVARRDGMKLLDWRADPDCGACFSTFVFRPEVSQVERGISHPVKGAILHEAICAIVPSGFPRMKRAKLDGWSILADDYRFLVKFCRAHGVRTVAEFGPGDSTLALLDAGCRVLSHEHDINWLRMATERFENEPDVEVFHCPEGLVPEWNGLETDLVFVDGPPYREGQAMSRIGPCEWALEHCGCFLLHDAKRHGERATLEEMEHRGLHVAPIPTTKGMALVVDPVKKPRLASSIETWRRIIDESPGFGWRADEWFAWSVLLREDARPMRILHCGAADGGLSGLLLERIFTHRESEIHAIDCYDGEEGGRMRETFEKRVLAGGNADRIHLHEGTAREALAWMIAEENYWEGFDVAIMNPREQAPELLADACQAWSLLRPGGVLVFPEQGQGSEAAEAFLRVFAARLERWLDSGRAVVRKRW